MSSTLLSLVGKNKKNMKKTNTNNLQNLDREKKMMKKKIWVFKVKFQEEDEYIGQWRENNR